MKNTTHYPAKTLAALGLLLTLAATPSPAAEAATATNVVAAAPAGKLPVVRVKDYLAKPAAYAGQEIVLQGYVTEVCKRKGCWALLHDNDSDDKGQVRVKQNEEGDTFKAFLPELQGKTILVTGEVKETKIDTAYLDKWETNLKAAQAKAAQSPDKKADATDAYAPVLKQIATYRERVAKAERGYLSSYSFAVATWQPADAKN